MRTAIVLLILCTGTVHGQEFYSTRTNHKAGLTYFTIPNDTTLTIRTDSTKDTLHIVDAYSKGGKYYLYPERSEVMYVVFSGRWKWQRIKIVYPNATYTYTRFRQRYEFRRTVIKKRG